jgi:hypothetical protein
MTEFTKLKITFALALLGTLFALHPLLDRFADWGFLYLGYDLKVFYVYSLTSGLLSLCVYLYAVTLLNDHPHSWCERTGNSTYALAILVVPIYAGLYLSAKLAEQVAVSHVAWAAPVVALGLGMAWIALSQLVAWRIRRRLGEQDRVSKMTQLASQEIASLNRAKELSQSQHYDLSVVEAWRALEARLRQVLLHRGIVVDAADPQAVIQASVRKGILREPTLSLVAELKQHWTVAVSTEPLSPDAANESISAVRHILSVIPVKEHAAPVGARSKSLPDQVLAHV